MTTVPEDVALDEKALEAAAPVAWRVPVRLTVPGGGKQRMSVYTECLPYYPGEGVEQLGEPVPLYEHPAPTMTTTAGAELDETAVAAAIAALDGLLQHDTPRTLVEGVVRAYFAATVGRDAKEIVDRLRSVSGDTRRLCLDAAMMIEYLYTRPAPTVSGEPVAYADLHGTSDEARWRSIVRKVLEHHKIVDGVVTADLVSAILAAAPARAEVLEEWHLGSMNDGLFIINTPPRPSTDDQWHDRPDGPTVVLNVTDLSAKKAQAVVDAHNTAIRALGEKL